MLFALAPATDALTQRTPEILQAPKDVGAARMSTPQNKHAIEIQGAAPTILSAISTTEENGKVVVSISTKGQVDYKAFTLSQPRRLIVDFANAKITFPIRELPVNLAIVKQIRIRQMQEPNANTARLVFDLEDVKKVNHQIVAEGDTVRIFFPSNESAPAGPPKSGSAALPTAVPKSGLPAVKTSAASAQKTTSAPGAGVPAKAALANKPSAAEIPPSLAAKSAASQKPKPAPVQEATPAAKMQSQEKPAIAPKPEPPAAKTAVAPKPKPPSLPAATVPDKVASQEKPAATPMPVPRDAKTAVAPKARPTTISEAAAPAKASPAEKVAAEPKSEAPVKIAAAAARPRPAPAVQRATAPAERNLAVTEISGADAAARSKSIEETKQVPAPAKSTSPVRVSSLAQQPLPSEAPAAQPAPLKASAAPAQESRFGGAPLTLDLIDIPLVDFFRLMAEEGGINIVMDPEIRGTISIKVVKVPWDQILEAALTNNNLDKQIEGNLVRIAKKSTLQQEAKQREDLKKATVLAADVETRIKRLNYAKASAFVATLTEQKSVRGTVVVDERSNSLIITDIPSFVDKMVRLVEALDIPEAQVEIEARIVSANRDFARDLGVQFGFVQGNLQRTSVGGPNTFGTIGGTRPSATPTSTYAAGNPSTGRGASDAKASASAGVSTGTSSQNAGNFNVNLPATKAFGGIGVSVGNIFDTFLLDAAITAGESKGVAKLISQPKVTAQNNSSATITQGLRFPVQIVANNTISIQFQNAALTLVVTPQITMDGNIVLDIQIDNNTPDFSQQVNGVPSIRTSESRTRVLISDGGTTVIGGIIIETESNASDRIPGLASLPGLGNLFKRTSIAKTSQEVMFFITPKIIK